jgi:basic membrane protein A and related proteins
MNNKRLLENLMVQEILQAASLSVVLFIGVFCFLSHNVEGQVLDTEKSLQTKTQNFKSLQIAYLTDASFSDAGWGAFAYNAGLELMSKYNHNVTLQDNVTIPDIEKTVRSYANKNFDIIITQGFEWGDPVLNVAKDYPDTKFIVFTGLVKSKNVASIFPKQQDAAFILGALATMLSKNQTIGFIGGDEKYPNLRHIYEGYRQGAQYINPKTKVLETYLQDWDNETKGRSAALSQIAHGADILLHVADTSGKGVIDAAKEKGIYAFGAVSDQNKLAPDTVVTSFVLDPQKAYDSVFAMIHANNFTGDIFSPGLESFKNSTTEEGIVYIAPFHGFEEKIPAEIQTKLHEISRDIVNKKIIVAE